MFLAMRQPTILTMSACTGGGVLPRAPPHPLSWLVQGMEGAVPYQIHVAENYERQINNGLYLNPLKEGITAPDFLFLTRLLLSLLAILFAFDAVCGEREDGTLKLAFVGAVPRHVWLVGKWVGGMLTLSVGFILGILVGMLYLVLFGGAEFVRRTPDGFSDCRGRGTSLYVAFLYAWDVDLYACEAGCDVCGCFVANLGAHNFDFTRVGRGIGQSGVASACANCCEYAERSSGSRGAFGRAKGQTRIAR